MNQKLRNARKDRQWSQATAAEKITVSEREYQRWEQGIHHPNFDSLRKLCNAFGCSARDLGFDHHKDQLDDHQIEPWQHLKAVKNTSSERQIVEYARDIHACWDIFYKGEYLEAAHRLQMYLPLIVKLTKERSSHQKTVAGLASQACQLACLIASGRGYFGSALDWGKKAFEYATLAEDSNLKVASLIRQLITYWYCEQPQLLIESGQKALLYIENASPLLKGKVYAGMAEGYAWIGQQQEALRLMDHALSAYPNDSYENDPSFPYTYFDYFSLHEDISLMYLRLEQPQKAWNELKCIDQHTLLIPRRAELLSYQAEVGVALGDLDISYAYLKDAIELSNDRVSFERNYLVYKKMQAKWLSNRELEVLNEILLIKSIWQKCP